MNVRHLDNNKKTIKDRIREKEGYNFYYLLFLVPLVFSLIFLFTSKVEEYRYAFDSSINDYVNVHFETFNIVKDLFTTNYLGFGFFIILFSIGAICCNILEVVNYEFRKKFVVKLAGFLCNLFTCLLMFAFAITYDIVTIGIFAVRSQTYDISATYYIFGIISLLYFVSTLVEFYLKYDSFNSKEVRHKLILIDEDDKETKFSFKKNKEDSSASSTSNNGEDSFDDLQIIDVSSIPEKKEKTDVESTEDSSKEDGVIEENTIDVE